MITLRRFDYPIAYRGASDASASGQKWYRRLIKVDLSLMIAAAALGVLMGMVPSSGVKYIAYVAAVVVAGGFIVRYAQRTRRDAERWFDGRAVAESVKTNTWRYVMKARPFEDDAKCNTEFIRELDAILEQHRDLLLTIGELPEDPQQITKPMRQVRDLSWSERLELYKKQRLGDQIRWYNTKSEANRRLADRWSLASLGALGVAVAALLLIPIFGRVVNVLAFVSVIATAEAASIAWTQLGRHDELRHSYQMACIELTNILSLAADVKDEDDLRRFVDDVENAVSREHTMWVARRGRPLPEKILKRLQKD